VALAVSELAACGEPAIEMSLELPASAGAFDVSCIGAVQVTIRGADRGAPGQAGGQARPPDDRTACIEVGAQSSFQMLRQTIADRFAFALPASGLVGVDLRASTGTCNKELLPGDTVLYGAGKSRGGDELVVKLIPTMSCSGRRSAVVRPVDLVELTAERSCPAPVMAVREAAIGVAVFRPTAVDAVIMEAVNEEVLLSAAGLATVSLPDDPPPGTCLALEYDDPGGDLTTASCVRRAPGVCATSSQLELPVIAAAVAVSSVDLTQVDRYGGAVLGAVWGRGAGGTAPAPLAGATVLPVAPKLGSVVYASLAADRSRLMVTPAATATLSSGLFIAYVGVPVDVIVSAPGFRDERVRLASANSIGTSLVLLERL
jgi:hypothetical protein